jgi:hypothetical protein
MISPVTAPPVAAVEPVDVDDVIEMLNVGYFHWRLLLVCGMAFMAG